MNGCIFDIQRSSCVDGPGIRTTVFFKGCNLSCLWCHNPESRSAHPQMMLYSNKCTGCGVCKKICPQGLEACTLCGKCTLYCPNDARKLCGETYSVERVLKELLKDKRFYENSGGGVTFSGGECMLRIDFLKALLTAAKEHGLHTAVDTAGHVPYEYFEQILPYTDLFLYDFKCFDTEKHKHYTGVPNDRILDNLAKLLGTSVPVRIRIPIVPTVNDTVEEMEAIRSWLQAHGKPESVELLPYHAMGEHKYDAIGLTPVVFQAPDDETMERLRAVFL